MCLNVEPGEWIRVAEKEITFYKRVDVIEPSSGEHPFFSSPYRSYRYYTKENLLGKSLEIEGSQPSVIHKGFHGYTTREAARRAQFLEEIILECIIPIGAEYCYGSHGEVVSNQMRICALSNSTFYNRFTNVTKPRLDKILNRLK